MKKNIAKIGVVLLASAAALTFTACDDNIVKGTMTDSRDGKTYKTVKIGDKVWMAENLNYKTDKSKCLVNKPENCEKYGRLYFWKEALNACPDGWHLPSEVELEELRVLAVEKYGENNEIGTMLKSRSGWKKHDSTGKNGNGTDRLGFGALPAGYYDGYNSAFYDGGRGASFWSSTGGRGNPSLTSGPNVAYGLFLDSYGRDSLYPKAKSYAFSVRCIKNSD